MCERFSTPNLTQFRAINTSQCVCVCVYDNDMCARAYMCNCNYIARLTRNSGNIFETPSAGSAHMRESNVFVVESD